MLVNSLISRRDLLFGVGLGLFSVLVIDYLVYLIPLVILMFLLKSFGEKYLLSLSIFLLLSFGSDIGESLREIMNLFSMAIIIYLIFSRELNIFEKLKKLPGSFVFLIFFVLGSMFVSSAFSSLPAIAFQAVGRQIIFFTLILLIFLLYNKREDFEMLFNTIVISGVAVSTFIIYSFFSSSSDLQQLLIDSYVKQGGLFKNIAAAGGLLMITIGATLVVITSRSSFSENSRRFVWLFLFIQIIAFLLTNSRAAFMGLSLAGGLMFFSYRRKLFYRTATVGLLLIPFIIFLFPEIVHIFSNFLRLERVLENTRYYLWDIMFRMINDNPVLGVGPMITKYNLDRYINVLWGSWDAEQLIYNFEKGGLGQAHNFYIFRWTELGIPGLFSSVLLPGIFVFYSLRILKHLRGSGNADDRLYSGILFIGAGVFLRGVFEATGILSHGWISRDLPFWLLFITVLHKFTEIHASQNRETKTESEK